jgi:hypothetical protein
MTDEHFHTDVEFCDAGRVILKNIGATLTSITTCISDSIIM